MKKIITFILLTCFVCSLLNVANADINNEQDFFNYLDSIQVNRANKLGKLANYDTYKDYNLIVYGSPWGDIKTNGINGKTGPQYRYLGYTFNDDPYTNPYFPPDQGGGGEPEKFIYIKVDGASTSWDAINDPAQHDHMLYSTLTGNGATRHDFSVAFIGGTDYAKVLSASTWKSSGSVFTRNKKPNGVYYATFTTPPMIGNTVVTCSVSTPANTYKISAFDDEVTIPVTVTSKALLYGYARASQVKMISANFNGGTKSEYQKDTAALNSDYKITRAMYPPGTHQIKLEGTSHIRSIFADVDTAHAYKTITLIVEEKGKDPYVNTSVTPEPPKTKFENQDINVKLTVKGDLKNYTTISNIKQWVLFIKEENNDASLKTLTLTNKSLSASGTFDFTIPKSKITGDSFTQSYVGRARAFFNVKVNGKDYVDAPATASVLVSKEQSAPNTPPPIDTPPPPTQPSNLPPVSVISTTFSAQAGEDVPMSGIKSYDVDGTIEGYTWETPEAVGAISGMSGSVWYPVSALGSNNIALTVADNMGDLGNTSQLINITPPYPTAQVGVSGTLKENRKVTIYDSSSSPTHYPINSGKTVFTITPVSGGTSGDIKYSGTLSGSSSKDVLFKKAGQYKVSISVENTAGYSDSYERVITIVPDLPPIAEYSMMRKVYRDKYDDKYAPIELQDMSYSPDRDKIKDKIWTVTYNANNNVGADGWPNFSDDVSFTIKESELVGNTEKIYTCGGVTYRVKKLSDQTLIIKSQEVGEYLIELEVVEDFGQPTIAEFITAADYKRGNTLLSKHLIEKILQIWNRAPYGDFAP